MKKFLALLVITLIAAIPAIYILESYVFIQNKFSLDKKIVDGGGFFIFEGQVNSNGIELNHSDIFSVYETAEYLDDKHLESSVLYAKEDQLGKFKSTMSAGKDYWKDGVVIAELMVTDSVYYLVKYPLKNISFEAHYLAKITKDRGRWKLDLRANDEYLYIYNILIANAIYSRRTETEIFPKLGLSGKVKELIFNDVFLVFNAEGVPISNDKNVNRTRELLEEYLFNKNVESLLNEKILAEESLKNLKDYIRYGYVKPGMPLAKSLEIKGLGERFKRVSEDCITFDFNNPDQKPMKIFVCENETGDFEMFNLFRKDQVNSIY